MFALATDGTGRTKHCHHCMDLLSPSRLATPLACERHAHREQLERTAGRLPAAGCADFGWRCSCSRASYCSRYCREQDAPQHRGECRLFQQPASLCVAPSAPACRTHSVRRRGLPRRRRATGYQREACLALRLLQAPKFSAGLLSNRGTLMQGCELGFLQTEGGCISVGDPFFFKRWRRENAELLTALAEAVADAAGSADQAGREAVYKDSLRAVCQVIVSHERSPQLHAAADRSCQLCLVRDTGAACRRMRWRSSSTWNLPAPGPLVSSCASSS